MNDWYIVIEADGLKSIYQGPISRESALNIVESNFESGNLTGNRYKKLSVYEWQTSKGYKLRLVREAQLNATLTDV